MKNRLNTKNKLSSSQIMTEYKKLSPILIAKQSEQLPISSDKVSRSMPKSFFKFCLQIWRTKRKSLAYGFSAAVFVAAALFPLFGPGGASAAVGTILPNEDISLEGEAIWPYCSGLECVGERYSYINKNAKDSSDTDLYINTGDADGDVSVAFGMSSISNIETVSKIELHIKVMSSSTELGSSVEVYLEFDGSGSESAQITPEGEDWAVYSLEFEGSWSQSDLDSLEVVMKRVAAESEGFGPAPLDDIRVSALSADVTFMSSADLTQSSARWFENYDGLKVSDDYEMLSTNGSFGENIRSVAWSPDGQMLAVGRSVEDVWGDQTLTIYTWLGDELVGYLITVDEQPGGHSVYSLAWSPDGRFLSVGLDDHQFDTSASFFAIYEVDGNMLFKQSSPSHMPMQSVRATAWSPDGQYLVFGASQDLGSGDYFVIYQRSGNTFTKIANPTAMPGDDIRALAWSSDSQFLAVGGVADGINMLTIYQRSGNTFTKIANPTAMPTDVVQSLAWSPNGRYLSVGTAAFGSERFIVYQRDQLEFTRLSPPEDMPGESVLAMSWSPNGRYLSVGGDGLTIYRYEDGNFIKLPDPVIMPGENVRSVAWSPNGRYLSVGSEYFGMASSAVAVYVFNTSAGIGDPIADQDEQGLTIGEAEPIRLRMLARADSGAVAAESLSLALQYSAVGSDETCDTGFAFENYQNVGVDSGAIRFHNNIHIEDGEVIDLIDDDPSLDGVSIVPQTYVESNGFTNRQAIPMGAAGLWDFALADFEGDPHQVFCFRLVNNGGDEIGGYDIIAEAKVRSAEFVQSGYRWYEDDNDSLGSPLAATNKPARLTRANQTARLRMALDVSKKHTVHERFQLQYVPKLESCDISFDRGKDVTLTAGGALVTAGQPSQAAGEASESAWQDTANLIAGGSAKAEVFDGWPTDFLKITGFNLDIPNDATVTGVEARVQRIGAAQEPFWDEMDYEYALVAGGVIQDTEVASDNTWPTGETERIFGGNGRKWGLDLTPAIVNDADFGFAISVAAYGNFSNETVDLGPVEIRVYYTSPDGQSPHIGFSLETSTVGQPMSISTQDPDSNLPLVHQSVVSGGAFSVVNQAQIGQAALWEFVISDFSDRGGSYCFRVVDSNGSPIHGYEQIPELHTPPRVSQMMRHGRWFDTSNLVRPYYRPSSSQVD